MGDNLRRTEVKDEKQIASVMDYSLQHGLLYFMLTVMLVDDNDDCRHGVKEVMELNGFSVLEASNGFQAIDLLKANAVDLAIIDMKMPGMDGIGTIKALKLIDCALPIIMFTGHASILDTVTAMQTGAINYIEKGSNYDVLIHLIKQLCLDDKNKLTVREKQILGWIRDGKTNVEIAIILSISADTVKTHVSNLLDKLNASTRASAIDTAYRKRILTP